MTYLSMTAHSRDGDDNRGNKLWHPYIPTPNLKTKVKTLIDGAPYNTKNRPLQFRLVAAEVQEDGDICNSI